MHLLPEDDSERSGPRVGLSSIGDESCEQYLARHPIRGFLERIGAAVVEKAIGEEGEEAAMIHSVLACLEDQSVMAEARRAYNDGAATQVSEHSSIPISPLSVRNVPSSPTSICLRGPGCACPLCLESLHLLSHDDASPNPESPSPDDDECDSRWDTPFWDDSGGVGLPRPYLLGQHGQEQKTGRVGRCIEGLTTLLQEAKQEICRVRPSQPTQWLHQWLLYRASGKDKQGGELDGGGTDGGALDDESYLTTIGLSGLVSDLERRAEFGTMSYSEMIRGIMLRIGDTAGGSKLSFSGWLRLSLGWPKPRY